MSVKKNLNVFRKHAATAKTNLVADTPITMHIAKGIKKEVVVATPITKVIKKERGAATPITKVIKKEVVAVQISSTFGYPLRMSDRDTMNTSSFTDAIRDLLFVGKKVKAKWNENEPHYYDTTISELHGNGSLNLDFDDGSYWDRAPRRVLLQYLNTA